MKSELLKLKDLSYFDDNLKSKILPEKIKFLFNHQKENWQMFKTGWEGFQQHQTKVFKFGEFEIKVQFNPTRFISSSAKVDPKTIAERKCFLCLENLPEDQKGILIEDKILILCNPAPIFNEHYTLTHIMHIEQRIDRFLELMLKISKDAAGHYTLFYNGPRCGASAPDHLHYQACPTDSLITETDIKQKADQLEIIDFTNDYFIAYFKNYLRNFILIRSNKKGFIINKFDKIYHSLKEITNTREEPLMNLFSFFHKDEYNLVIFPREKHRPSVYFDEGDDRILISPGLVDMAGTIITPLQKDFEIVDEILIKNIYEEVSINNDSFNRLISSL